MKGRIVKGMLVLTLVLAVLALAGCREFPSLGPLEKPPPPPIMACMPGNSCRGETI